MMDGSSGKDSISASGAAESPNTVNGTVKWFDTRRGFGFIVSPEGEDVFVHYSKVIQDGYRTLKDGWEVSYNPVQGDKGWFAENVKPLGEPPVINSVNDEPTLSEEAEIPTPVIEVRPHQMPTSTPDESSVDTSANS